MTRPNESGGGGLTGATGDLTPDEPEQPFIPAEQRAMLSPEPETDASIAADEPEAGTGGTAPNSADGDEFSDHEEHF
ncbi:MAG TPA: hypothetical protein VEW95_11400 [Candidatus Limnocylindrales bacterium]|nr:hypothetical protein [Candidatus Limnocylindrales bacterium]